MLIHRNTYKPVDEELTGRANSCMQRKHQCKRKYQFRNLFRDDIMLRVSTELRQYWYGSGQRWPGVQRDVLD